MANAGALSPPMREALRALGIAGFLLVIARQRSPAIAGRSQDLAPETGFGRPYWLVVAVEAAVALGGATILSRGFSAPQADLPWITFVVGAHFFALAVVFRQPRYHLLGTAITACGVVGLVAVVAGAGDPVTAVIAGIVPGFTLLLAALWGTRRPTSGRPPRSECIEAS